MIQLSDLFSDEIERVYAKIFDGERYPLTKEFTPELLDQRTANYHSDLSILAAASMAYSYWSTEADDLTTNPLTKLVERLGSPPSPEASPRKAGLTALRNRYPITYLSFIVGTMSVESENWTTIRSILIDPEFDEWRNDKLPLFKIHPWELGADIGDRGAGNRYLRSRFKKSVYPVVQERIPSVDRYRLKFEMFEALVDLIYLSRIDERQKENLRYVEHSYDWNIIERIQDELDTAGENWGPIKYDLFDSRPWEVEAAIDYFDDIFDPMGYVEIP